MKLALIPARGGSKRIPRKNIRPFCGRPIIAWSIAAAQDSGCFDRIVVSTDDAEIAEVARQAGAEVPFMRPAELADDHAGTIAVVRHAVGWQAAEGTPARAVCCLYPTAPFVRAADLQHGLALLESSGADFAVPVARYPFPVQRAVRLDARGRMAMLDPRQFNVRSQDLEETYHDAGQFYWGTARAWSDATTVFGADTAAMVLPSWRVQDIDVPEDWTRAEALFRALEASAE